MHYELDSYVGLLLYTAGELKKNRNSGQMLSFSGCKLQLFTSHNFSFFMAEGSTLSECRTRSFSLI